MGASDLLWRTDGLGNLLAEADGYSMSVALVPQTATARFAVWGAHESPDAVVASATCATVQLAMRGAEQAATCAVSKLMERAAVMNGARLRWHTNAAGVLYADTASYYLVVSRIIPAAYSRFIVRAAAGGYILASGSRPSTDAAIEIAEQIAARLLGRDEVRPSLSAAAG